MKRRRVLLALLGAAALAVASIPAGEAASPAGFNTGQSPMLTLGPGAPPGSSVDALIAVPETLPGGYQFEAIPDGISLRNRGQGRVDVYVNHETSTVPFPFNSPWPQAAGVEANQNDFDNSQVSHLTFSQQSGNILHGSYAIKSMENWQRFCSNYLATAVEGFDRPILFTNEEAQDLVFRTGTAWPGPTFIPDGTNGAEQAGVVVAHDVQNGKTKPIYGMGRHNHENSVAMPGFDDLVVISGDDTFSTSPASSQLYLYAADDRQAIWNDEGTLYAFVAEGKNTYTDVTVGETVPGHFIEVPKEIATGKDAGDGHELMSSDFPTWTFGVRPAGTPDGPQWVLDQWGNASNNDEGENVFDFIRIEDTAYDKRPGMSNVMYLVDSGRGTAGPIGPTVSTNGRIWKLELDPDGTGNYLDAELSILVQGDDNVVKTPGEIHQPDNIESTPAGSLLVQEDPGSSQQFNPGDVNATTARIWQVPLGAADPDASKVVVAAVDQSLDENANPALGAVDVDAAPAGRLGAWESSGIVDASASFGPGAFLVTVQAHSYWVQKMAGPDVLNAPNGPDYFFKREGGQLLLLKLPGV
ncbi:MAG TPA: hypothetical protein VFR32_07225 [Gaiellaceae bacterium]|nr:hypothetical protein [Gaiellaceae bacterium]